MYTGVITLPTQISMTRLEERQPQYTYIYRVTTMNSVSISHTGMSTNPRISILPQYVLPWVSSPSLAMPGVHQTKSFVSFDIDYQSPIYKYSIDYILT